MKFTASLWPPPPSSLSVYTHEPFPLFERDESSRGSVPRRRERERERDEETELVCLREKEREREGERRERKKGLNKPVAER